jgi:integrase
MARPKKDAAIDLSVTHELSFGLIERLTCPPGALKAFLRDKDVTGLRVRVTANGVKAFVFEAKLNGKAISKTIGGFPLTTIEDAKDKARELAKLIKTDKQDPRELERQQQATKVTTNAAAAAQAVTVGEVWTTYLEARKPHWGVRHHSDHAKLVQPGGELSKRGTRGRGVTIAGPLHSLMAMPLRDLTAPVVEAWAATEAKTRPTSARLAWRCLKAFLGWCAEQPEYAPALSGANPAKSKRARESLGKAGVKQDALLREQLPAWFAAVQQVSNPIAAAYLQILLLTGARPGEVLGLRWDDINTKWSGLTIRDKVEGERVIPLTPYVSHLVHALPRRSEWVFSSASKDTKGQTLSIPRNPHNQACAVAGIDGLTLHGLRRSFKSLTEWLEIPAGVVAQLMGHKPSATAEKHYTVRPLDLLRVHHEKIEAWILEQAGVTFDAKAEPGKLRVVGAA